MKTLGIDLPSFGDPPAATGGFSIDDLTDFARSDVFDLLEGPDADGEPDLETLLANAAAQGRNEGYAEGVEAGKTEALAGVESALLARLEEALNSLDAIALDLEADRLRFLQSVFGALLPSLAQRGFPMEAAAALEKAVKKDANAQKMRVKIFCPVGAHEALQSVLQSANDQSQVEIKEDAELTGAALRMAWREGGLDLDVNRAITAVMEALSPYAVESAANEFEQDEPEQVDVEQVGVAQDDAPYAEDDLVPDSPADEGAAASDGDFAIEPTTFADANDADAVEANDMNTDGLDVGELDVGEMDSGEMDSGEFAGAPAETPTIADSDSMADPTSDFDTAGNEDANDGEDGESIEIASIEIASIEIDEPSDGDDEIDADAFEPLGGMEIIEDLDDGEETS